jgi:hypothetical protein
VSVPLLQCVTSRSLRWLSAVSLFGSVFSKPCTGCKHWHARNTVACSLPGCCLVFDLLSLRGCPRLYARKKYTARRSQDMDSKQMLGTCFIVALSLALSFDITCLIIRRHKKQLFEALCRVAITFLSCGFFARERLSSGNCNSSRRFKLFYGAKP